MRAAGSFLVMLSSAMAEGLSDWQRALPFNETHTALALVLLGLTAKWPALLLQSGLAVGLLDMPVLCLTSLPALASKEEPVFLLGSLAPALAAGVVLSAVALDFTSTALATLSALGCVAVLLRALHAPLAEFGATRASPVRWCSTPTRAGVG
jgi:hypothetical protein